jgi:hypothetical protein
VDLALHSFTGKARVRVAPRSRFSFTLPGISAVPLSNNARRESAGLFKKIQE